MIDFFLKAGYATSVRCTHQIKTNANEFHNVFENEVEYFHLPSGNGCLLKCMTYFRKGFH